jgi:DNA-binding MarR family transcriptional regulator
MIRNHICNSLIQLKVNDRNPDCCDLSMAQMNLLLAVRRREELTLSGLAETLKVSPPSCSATG